MFAAVFDEKFQLLGQERKKTKGYQGASVGVERVVGTIREALANAKVSPNQIAGIGVGCPGPLHLDEGILIEAVNLGWHNVPLKDLLEKEFSCPVCILNDVDAGVFGEYHQGAGQGAHCLLGVFPGTGIGGGCVYRGEIFRGRNQSCMEIGHIPLFPMGKRDGTNLVGTMEAYASRLAIAAGAAQAAYRGQAPSLLKNVGTDLAAIRSSAIANAVKAGDKAVEQVVIDAAQIIGVGLAGAVNLLCPDIIVLGGGLVEAMSDLFVKHIEKTAREHVIDAFRDSFEVVPAKLGDLSGVIGAAAWQAASEKKSKGK